MPARTIAYLAAAVVYGVVLLVGIAPLRAAPAEPAVWMEVKTENGMAAVAAYGRGSGVFTVRVRAKTRGPSGIAMSSQSRTVWLAADQPARLADLRLGMGAGQVSEVTVDLRRYGKTVAHARRVIAVR